MKLCWLTLDDCYFAFVHDFSKHHYNNQLFFVVCLFFSSAWEVASHDLYWGAGTEGQERANRAWDSSQGVAQQFMWHFLSALNHHNISEHQYPSLGELTVPLDIMLYKMLIKFHVTFSTFLFEVIGTKWNARTTANEFGRQYTFFCKETQIKLQQRKADYTMLFVDRRFPIDVIFCASVWGRGERKERMKEEASSSDHTVLASSQQQ